MNILEFFHSLQTQAKNVGAPFRVPSCMHPVESHTSRTKRSARSGWCTSRGDELVPRRHQNTPERNPFSVCVLRRWRVRLHGSATGRSARGFIEVSAR
jgi:hypothetical protein